MPGSVITRPEDQDPSGLPPGPVVIVEPRGPQGVPGRQGPPGIDHGPELRLAYAANPDLLITGAITRDANGAATSASVTWPDGTTGTYTATTLSTAFPGAVDAYTITYGSPATETYTQPALTRDPTTGAVTARPAIVRS